MEKLSNKISKEASKLEELEIRQALIEEVLTPYASDTEEMTANEQRYFMDNVLPKIVDGIGFIREDMGNVRGKLTSISYDHRED
ncbi:hypothetical protein AB9M75_12480 [Lactobacillus sp. AN1001]